MSVIAQPAPGMPAAAATAPDEAELSRLSAALSHTQTPLTDVLSAVFDDLVAELCVDICAEVHKEAHTRGWILPHGPLVDVFGQPYSKKVPDRSFKCESCGQKTGAAKYAAHLEKCTGKGGRASARARSRMGSGGGGTGAAGSGSGRERGDHSAAVSSAAHASASAAAGLPPVAAALALAAKDDDLEVATLAAPPLPVHGTRAPLQSRLHAAAARQAAAVAAVTANGGFPAPLSLHLGGGSGAPSPVPSGSSRANSPSAARGTPLSLLGGRVRPGSSQEMASPLGASESPFADVSASVSPSVGGPALYDIGSGWHAGGSDDVMVIPSGSALAGQKRKMDEAWSGGAGNASFATSGIPGSQPPKKRRALKSDDLWTDPLPAELPTQASHGGQPYLVDAAEAEIATAPTHEQLQDMVFKICAVPSSITRKLCSNKPTCGTHNEQDRINIKAAILNDEVFVRFKKVPAKPSAVAAGKRTNLLASNSIGNYQ